MCVCLCLCVGVDTETSYAHVKVCMKPNNLQTEHLHGTFHYFGTYERICCICICAQSLAVVLVSRQLYRRWTGFKEIFVNGWGGLCVCVCGGVVGCGW